MDKRLKEASNQGSIDDLYALIEENPRLLDHLDDIPFVETPLHVAASSGQARFAREIIRLKPAFAKKLNKQGLTPTHLALQAGDAKMVAKLLEADRGVGGYKGREGRTPLHVAAEAGDVGMVAGFLWGCPKCVEDVTVGGDTALHVALKSGREEVFEAIVEWLGGGFEGEEDYYRERTVLNWKDEDGDTVLHVAASRNQYQALSILVKRGIDIHARNLNGLTALDILESQPDADNEELRNLLYEAGASKSSTIPPIDNFGCYLRPDQRLKKAAAEGTTDALFSIIREDPYLLDRIDQVHHVDTPLHIAAAAGHTKFALEMMRLKPSFSRKPNIDGNSPIHLALQNEQTETVLRLLDVDGDLVRVKAVGSVTPLHFAAKRQQLDLLAEFLAACPRSIEDVTIHKETALHVAAKNDRLMALEVLVGWLEHTDQNKVLDWTDDEGNTVLHIASQRNLTEVISYLIGPATNPLLGSVFPIVRILFPSMLLGIKANLNVKNLKGATAVDILEAQGQFDAKDINAMRRVAKYLGAPVHPAGASDLSGYLRSKMSWLERWAVSDYREKSHMTDENRNGILVVTVLIATATYQAVLSPPGGVWQGDPTWLAPTKTSTNITNATTSNTTEFNPLHMVGRSVMSMEKWTIFSTVNTMAFSISLFKMYRLLPRGPYFVLRLVLPLLLCYALSLVYISPTGWPVVVILFLVCSHAVFLKSTVAHVFIYKRKWAVKRLFGKTLSEISNRSGSSRGRYSDRSNSF